MSIFLNTSYFIIFYLLSILFRLTYRITLSIIFLLLIILSICKATLYAAIHTTLSYHFNFPPIYVCINCIYLPIYLPPSTCIPHAGVLSSWPHLINCCHLSDFVCARLICIPNVSSSANFLHFSKLTNDLYFNINCNFKVNRNSFRS